MKRFPAAATLAALIFLLPFQAASAKSTGQGRVNAPGQLKKQPPVEIVLPTPPTTVQSSPQVNQPKAGGPVVAQKVDPAPSGGHNPPGNNGTIKIDRQPFDDHPNNQPHVDCEFQVDFYGFDEGASADVDFQLHSPTTDGRLVVNGDVQPFIGGDDASGGGSEAGLDASVTYRLEFPGVTPHPKQGVHVKLTIHAEGSQGADTKHKVFWVQPCQETPPTTVPPTTSTTVPPTTTTVPTTKVCQDNGPCGVSITAPPAPKPPAPPAPSGELARTGGELGLIAALALVLIFIGTVPVVTDRIKRWLTA